MKITLILAVLVIFNIIYLTYPDDTRFLVRYNPNRADTSLSSSEQGSLAKLKVLAANLISSGIASEFLSRKETSLDAFSGNSLVTILNNELHFYF